MTEQTKPSDLYEYFENLTTMGRIKPKAAREWQEAYCAAPKQIAFQKAANLARKEGQ